MRDLDLDRQLDETEEEIRKLERWDFIAGSIVLILIALAAALAFNFAYDMGWIFAQGAR